MIYCTKNKTGATAGDLSPSPLNKSKEWKKAKFGPTLSHGIILIQQSIIPLEQKIYLKKY